MATTFLQLRARILPLLTVFVLPLAAQQSDTPHFSAEQIQFFETNVRPLFEKNCMVCHNDKLRTSGLSVASRQGILTGGNRGPSAIPGRPDQSALLAAVGYSGDLKMPPTGKLQNREIEALAKWVEQGLPWSPEQVSEGSEQKGDQHWSFQPVRRNPPPQVKNSARVRNPIDNFVLARLEKKGLEASPTADRATLIRRVSLDLIGLTPSPQEVREFVADERPDAYERLVDRLLESPHYGERWGRRWLDLARYADSNGYNIDGPREIWMYRDWVINALNRDLPFDQFVIEQIAGDMLPNPTQQQIVATGLHRNTLLNLEGGIDFEQYRVESVVDRVDMTGAVFLGLTLGCARCHDHKYDPISQREFYQFYAFFNNIDELSGEFENEAGRKRAHEPLLEFGSTEEFTRRGAMRGQLALLEKERDEYLKALLPKQPEWEKSLTAEERSKLEAELVEILALPVDERNDFQKIAAENAFKAADPGYSARQKGIDALRAAEPKLKSTMIMRELPKPREAYIHLGGDFLRKGITVKPGTPAVLPPLPSKDFASRLDLARWLVDPKNPLTPRVTVNRLWQRYFGNGLVRTENDFGTQGSPPSHPELLDWLASELVARGWSLKSMHRLIVNSATYRQSSSHRPALTDADSDNQLLARQNRLRLEAEIVRDAALTASGLFTPTVGGPSVFPPQPEGAGSVTQIDRQWTADKDGNRYRRGMYTYFWRSAPHPGLMVFDGPDSMTSCTRRNRSNTPLQALTLLNDDAFYEFAQGVAQRVLQEAPPSNPDRMAYAFQLCLARPPKPEEQSRLEQFLAVQLDDFQTHPDEAQLVVPADLPDGTDVPLLAAWSSLSRVLLNLDEFITRE